ncbi:MAG TPA: NAD(P)H-dependent glycerol-3-phosphate dehydrogenase [Stellaceae bacterium]|nr:NAD(P)H-dependent glycerol-3-phosphate dehydrogenase [Stellaceae bacterium]
MSRLVVIGAGAWGTALAMVARRAGSEVVVWARDPAIAEAIGRHHRNPVYLPDIVLDPAIAATAHFEPAVAGADAAVIAVPAQFLRAALVMFGAHLPPALPLLLCAKGIETGSLMTMSELVGALHPENPLAVLSGPSFAAEVARDLPTAVTIAGRPPAAARFFAAALGSPRFRPYLSEDPVGVEIGGAVKNVLAIACGIVDGLGLGDNARAALITRGLAEMTRLGVAKGARAETFAGLSGLGDLVLTCGGAQSRNHALGVALGRGESLDAALAGRRSVVEGVASAASVAALAARLGVEMPIAAAVDAVLHRGKAIAPAIEELLARPRRSE